MTRARRRNRAYSTDYGETTDDYDDADNDDKFDENDVEHCDYCHRIGHNPSKCWQRQKDYKYWMTKIKTLGGDQLAFAPSEFCSDTKIVKEACKRWGLAIKYACPELQEDFEIARVACKQNPLALKQVSSYLQSNKSFVLQVVNTNGLALKYACKDLQNDKKVVIEACREDGLAIQYATDKLREDKTVVLEALRGDGLALQYVPRKFRDFHKYVLAAVKQNGSALQLASKSLQGNKKIVLAACSQNGWAISYAAPKLQNDRDVLLVACGQNGMVLANVDSEKYRSDKEIVISAASSNPDALKFALGGLNQDPDCLKASGIWDADYGKDSTTRTCPSSPSSPLSQSSTQTQTLQKRKIVLSTRFALNDCSNSKATQFAVLLKQNPYIQDRFYVYSPNAFEKHTCDVKWTRFSWPCRGTYETCQKPDNLKMGVPVPDCCWRYSYRYQLKEAKRTGGIMIQLVEVGGNSKFCDTEGKPRSLGAGQAIENEMAHDLGVKIFRVYAPIQNRGHPQFEREVEFNYEDIQKVVFGIKQWYRNDCRDMNESETKCVRSRMQRDGSCHSSSSLLSDTHSTASSSRKSPQSSSRRKSNARVSELSFPSKSLHRATTNSPTGRREPLLSDFLLASDSKLSSQQNDKRNNRRRQRRRNTRKNRVHS